MALYLGREKIKINLNGGTCCLNLFSAAPILSNIILLSSDNYILKDSNGIYLLPNDCTSIITDKALLSLDGYVLKSFDELYLTTKEDK